MAVAFVSASSQRVINSGAPVTAVPFSIGFWVKMPTSATDQVLWSLVDTASVTEYWAIYKNTSNILVTNVNAGAGYSEVATTNAIGNNQWTYVVFRAINATNRRISVLHSSGTIDNAQQTTSRTPASIDRVCLGMSDYATPDSPMDGSIAEYWMTNADIQADGAALLATTVQKLAYRGPFSIPEIRRSIVDYRSFRSSFVSATDWGSEVFSGGGVARQTWTAVNSPTLAPHPPLAGTYRAPANAPRLIAV